MASEEQPGPVQRLQAAIEHLSGQDNIPEGVYLDACNALKELYTVTKLFKVTYSKFYIERRPGIERSGDAEVAWRPCTKIMEQYGGDGHSYDVSNWEYVIDGGVLPREPFLSSLPIGKPFEMDGGMQGMVTAVEPYPA